jgi:hypothetical protein
VPCSTEERREQGGDTGVAWGARVASSGATMTRGLRMWASRTVSEAGREGGSSAVGPSSQQEGGKERERAVALMSGPVPGWGPDGREMGGCHMSPRVLN